MAAFNWNPARHQLESVAALRWNTHVEYFDDDGACYVTVFAGPQAERRARDYFEALKFGRLRTIRA